MSGVNHRKANDDGSSDEENFRLRIALLEAELELLSSEEEDESREESDHSIIDSKESSPDEDCEEERLRMNIASLEAELELLSTDEEDGNDCEESTMQKSSVTVARANQEKKSPLSSNKRRKGQRKSRDSSNSRNESTNVENSVDNDNDNEDQRVQKCIPISSKEKHNNKRKSSFSLSINDGRKEDNRSLTANKRKGVRGSKENTTKKKRRRRGKERGERHRRHAKNLVKQKEE